jgi:pimeloyl-ACP methyl ester carboxylesterase
MDASTYDLDVRRGPYHIHADVTPAAGTPIVLMHGFPDNVHLYDRLLTQLVGRQPVVRFDFLGWGRSDKPIGYPHTATNQVDDLAAVLDAAPAELPVDKVVLVAHDASGPPAIDWALSNPDRVARLVLLNTYYHWMPGLRRPPAIALYSTPVVRGTLRALVRRWPEIDRRLYFWQVGGFVHEPVVRNAFVAQLYADFPAARPAFWRLNDDLLKTVLSRRRRIPRLRQFEPTTRIIFGARDRYLNPGVARRFASLFPHSELHLLDGGGHYVQVDEPKRVADLIVAD